VGLDFEASVKAVVVLSVLLAAFSAYALGRRLFGRYGGFWRRHPMSIALTSSLKHTAAATTRSFSHWDCCR